ncbi:peptidoglycan bridge formation glycyltransferase FemA/FemB family protein [Candidatus Curtissbacteria bacterium]|nr:peptidoglycan bridge formation glycyltransferase FemA/FemB family protein [Candidatus Curtissbacteria bacterium]
MKYPPHLLQSPQWAQFRQRWGTRAVKVGKAYLTIHPVPLLPYTVGYIPRVFPKDIDWQLLKKEAARNRCIFVKIEPNSASFNPPFSFDVRPGERMFAHATYVIDLRKTEKELLTAMHYKTRYNIGLAKKRGIKIKVGHSNKMLTEFLDLFHKTSLRHKIAIHPDAYYKTLLDVFSTKGNAQIITGYYNRKPLASMMFVIFNDTIFYPYGGSTLLYKEKMAPYLVMWEGILLGKKRGCLYFDMWNCLLPEQESPSHPWYGFHRFKKGFNGGLLRFAGAYDVVFNDPLYSLFTTLNHLRWAILKILLALRKVTKR